MRSLRVVPFVAFAFACGVPHAAPWTAHEQQVGAQEEQVCTDAPLDVVARFLKLPPVPADADRGDSNVAQGTIVAAACKRRPDAPGITLVALAWQSGKPAATADEPGSKSLLVAALDDAHARVLASRRETIEEDASTRLDAGSLWIDTAYLLAPGVRAFGVDFTRGYIAHCNDGDSGASRTLYVQEGAAIRPISAPLTMSSSEITQRHDRCGSGSGPTVIDDDVATISVAAPLANGWHDLVVTNTGTHEVTDEDGQTRSTPGGRTQTRWVYVDGTYRAAGAPRKSGHRAARRAPSLRYAVTLSTTTLGASTTRLRPPSLAEYRAVSARL